MTPAERAKKSRRAQGLPAEVADPVVLEKVARAFVEPAAERAARVADSMTEPDVASAPTVRGDRTPVVGASGAPGPRPVKETA